MKKRFIFLLVILGILTFDVLGAVILQKIFLDKEIPTALFVLNLMLCYPLFLFLKGAFFAILIHIHKFLNWFLYGNKKIDSVGQVFQFIYEDFCKILFYWSNNNLDEIFNKFDNLDNLFTNDVPTLSYKFIYYLKDPKLYKNLNKEEILKLEKERREQKEYLKEIDLFLAKNK